MSKPKSNLKWSLNKSTVKLIQSLKQQKFRKEHGLFVVEGRKMVEELLQSNMKTLCLYATERFLRDYEINDDRLEIATDIQMEQMSGQDTPPGILAVVEVPQPRAIKEEGMILALDGIANPGNMGTIIRTAEWFGMNQIVCSEDCVELWNPKVIQATMGSIFRMNVTSVNLASYLDEAKKSGKAVYGALLDGENIFSKERWDDGVIVIGSESHGIRSEVLHYITHPITIPRAEGSVTESLNASMAAGIIMAEIRNR
ncbi:MAG: RNA methyltransferase [Bacteroidales bacterium]|nr:RNA methyltransferase [Bacteroidales bacterium]